MPFTTAQPEVFQRVQFGVQSGEGVQASADKRFHSAMFDVDPQVPITAVQQAGKKFDVDTVAGKDHTKASVKGDASVQDLLYMFAAGLCTPTFSTPGVNAHLATFAPLSDAPNPFHYLTIEKGIPGTGNANRFIDGVFTDVELAIVPDKQVSLTAAMLGQSYVTDVDLTASPTSLGATVLSPKLVDVYLATSVGGLGAAQIDPLSATFRIQKLLGDVYDLRSDKASFSELVESRPTLSCDLVLKKGTFSNSLLAAMKATTEYFLQIVLRGAFIETVASVDYYQMCRITMPCRFDNPGEGTAQDLHTATLRALGQDDEGFNGSGGALLIECQSTLPAL